MPSSDDVWDYHFVGSNTRDMWVQFVCIYVLLISGALVAYYFFHAPWWIYAGIGFLAFVATIAGIDGIRKSGTWEIMLDRDRGGRIVSPQGWFEFNQQALVGFGKTTTHRRQGETHTSFVILFSNHYLVLHETALDLFQLRAEFQRLWPDLPVNLSGSDDEILSGKDPIEWIT